MNAAPAPASADDAWIGDRIRYFRLETGTERREIVELMVELGFPWTEFTLTAVEAGTRPLLASEARHVCRMLAVSMAELDLPLED